MKNNEFVTELERSACATCKGTRQCVTFQNAELLPAICEHKQEEPFTAPTLEQLLENQAKGADIDGDRYMDGNGNIATYVPEEYVRPCNTYHGSINCNNCGQCIEYTPADQEECDLINSLNEEAIELDQLRMFFCDYDWEDGKSTEERTLEELRAKLIQLTGQTL